MPQSTASSRRAARRRSRHVASGREPRPEDVAPTATTTTAGGQPPGSLLGRLFPPAPPLPGKGDPLAGFHYTGPPRWKGLVSGAWLLVRHPLVWGAAAAGWAVLQLALLVVTQQNVLAFAITFAQYGLLIGAGWIAWWRPWLFGLAAGVGGVLFQALLVLLLVVQSGEDLVRAANVFVSIIALIVLYGIVGTFAGFYGGYLRRRMAKPAPVSRRRR